MKSFPFKLVFLCVLLPAVLYGFTIQGLERYLTYRYTRGLEKSYIGEMEPLLSGDRRLRDVIRENVEQYLKNETLPSWMVEVEVFVMTSQGNILYPAVFQDLESSISTEENLAMARENFAILSEPLRVSVTISISFLSPISLSSLGFYILIAVWVLYSVYLSGLRTLRHEEEMKDLEIQRLQEQEGIYSYDLSLLEKERDAISADLERMETALKSEQAKATSTEVEMFDEIMALDAKLKENMHHQEQQLKEINALREKILCYEVEITRGERQRAKEADSINKRFKAIYKNIFVDDRAVDGFIALPDEMRIKAEEVIHRLNNEPDQVVIKRKVFGKKGRETVLEVLFSYNGRLYFRRTKSQGIDVLVIGTKNTQMKDLEYIDTIPRKNLIQS